MALITAPRPNLTLWDRLYFPGIIKGLKVTASHLFRKKVTMQFPEETWTFPENYRGFPKLVDGNDGVEKCVACKLCEVVCPPSAITIKIGEYTQVEKQSNVGLC